MDSKKTEALLEKYWNCETSLEEEQLLREYFLGNELPPQWKETAAMFRYFDQHKKKTLTDTAFDDRVIKKIKGIEKRKPEGSRGRAIKLFYNSMRIAAGVVVLVVATWLVRMEIRKTTPPQTTDTYNDPKIAFEETKKALLMISKSFGSAEEKARKINMFSKAQEHVQKEEPKSNL